MESSSSCDRPCRGRGLTDSIVIVVRGTTQYSVTSYIMHFTFLPSYWPHTALLFPLSWIILALLNTLFARLSIKFVQTVLKKR